MTAVSPAAPAVRAAAPGATSQPLPGLHDLAALMAAATVGSCRMPEAWLDDGLTALLSALGARVEPDAGSGPGAVVTVYGSGLAGLREPAAPLDLSGRAGLLAPLCGLLAGQDTSAILVPGHPLPEGLTTLLTTLGARADGADEGRRPPLTLRGRPQPMVPALTDDGALAAEPAPLALARLFAGLTAPGTTAAALPPSLGGPLADLLSAMGVPLALRLLPSGLVLTVTGEAETTPVSVPDSWPARPLWACGRGPDAPALVLAIDGPAAAGKGTLARAVAERLGLAYLDTGKIYRATAMAVLRAGGDPADPAAAEAAARGLDPATLADPALRGEDAGRAASLVAAIPGVRAALLDFQRVFARRPPDNAPGAVLDGRDIGSVVCPGAPVKLFVTASAEVRARRRFLELREAGQEVIESRVLQDMKERDARDSSRGVAPLVPAADAVVLDSSDLDRMEALAAALALAGDRLRAAEQDRPAPR